MHMTKTLAKQAARTIGKSLSSDDMDNWISCSHKDGSEFYFVKCYYELIKTPDDDKGWLVIWSKNHGTILFAEDDIDEWEGGEGCDDDDDPDLSGTVILCS